MKILVAGATGRVGRPLVEQLAQAGHQVLALTRTPSKANLPKGVEAVEGDLTNPSTLESALQGVEALHLITFGGNDYTPLQTGSEIVAMAEKAGVKRVTVLTGGTNSPLEQAVKASSLAWTMLGPVEFMSGAFDYAEQIRTLGEVRQPFGNRQTAIVHESDIAAVAAAALTQDGHAGKTYTITGSEILTPREMVRQIGMIIGREVPFVELTPEEARQEWLNAGMPRDIIEFMMWVYGATPVEGYTVSPDVERVTGHPPRTFAQWAQENVASFRAS